LHLLYLLGAVTQGRQREIVIIQKKDPVDALVEALAEIADDDEVDVAALMDIAAGERAEEVDALHRQLSLQPGYEALELSICFFTALKIDSADDRHR